MLDRDASSLSPQTTYCPFKAPSRLSLPAGHWEINLRRFEQRPGMALVHAAISVADDSQQYKWPGKSHLQIVFVSRGQLRIVSDSNESSDCSTGDWLLVKPAGKEFVFSCKESCQLHWLEFDEQSTASLTGFSDTVDPQLFDPNKTFLHAGSAVGRLLELGRELSELEGANTRERLLIEAKTLEWLALLLDQPAFSPCRAMAPQRAARDELALTAAARILETQFGEDHSIAQLSRMVHLNEFKLKRGFKEKFGTTVFGFLRQKRMERARELLQSGEQSVIEIANAVGYSNPSHFARAFKEAFGINPSELNLSH